MRGERTTGTMTLGSAPLARAGISVLFVLNAVTYANVVPRLPTIKDELGLSNTALGAALAAVPVGALASGAAAGWLVSRIGSARLAVGCAVALAPLLPVFALAPSWPVLAAVCLGLGALDSMMDVAMNAHALRVQRLYGRSIINGLHGLWSVGAVLGGLTGMAAAGADLDLTLHLAVAGAVVAATAIGVRGWLLPGGDGRDMAAEVAEGRAGGEPTPTVWDLARRRDVRAGLTVLGVIVVMSAVIEDAPQSWGAVLMREELGASAAFAGLAFISFQASMTLSRFAGDRLVDRMGTVRLVRVGSALTASAVGAGLLIGTPAATVVAFGLAGVGTAALFPVAFHAAGNISGVPTGHGVAVVASMGRVGFLAAPPLVGAIGDVTNLRTGLVVVPVAAAVVMLVAPSLSRFSAT